MVIRVSVLLLATLLVAAVWADGTASSSMRTRVSNRKENSLNSAMYGRASLLFRAMDKDHDKKISAEDVRSSPELLKQHMPQVSETEFLSFMEVADTDGDKKLDLEELLKGLSDGLQEAKKNNMLPAHLHEQVPSQQQHKQQQPTATPNLLETGANVHSDAQMASASLNRRHRDTETVGGGAMDARFMAQRSYGLESDQVKGGDDDCVMCQYIVERCEANIRQSGVLPGFSSVAAFDSYLELEQTVTPQQQSVDTAPASDDVSLLEVQHKQLYFDQTAAGIIGSTRQSTRVQRQLERQKYNEVYRVADLSLDDVCEQGMPIKFYGVCKKIYKLQSDVVDGLRYQYRPADICFRVGLCPKGSYITTGVHSRYKGV